MKVIWDTNILLDILQKRQPFFADSYHALRKAIDAEHECLMSASAAADIFYVLRKALHSSEKAKDCIEQLSQLLTFADVCGADIHTALVRPMPDFEDAVADAVAERCKVSYIVTRNVKDFTGSVVSAITPTDFLNMQP